MYSWFFSHKLSINIWPVNFRTILFHLVLNSIILWKYYLIVNELVQTVFIKISACYLLFMIKYSYLGRTPLILQPWYFKPNFAINFHSIYANYCTFSKQGGADNFLCLFLTVYLALLAWTLIILYILVCAV